MSDGDSKDDGRGSGRGGADRAPRRRTGGGVPPPVGRGSTLQEPAPSSRGFRGFLRTGPPVGPTRPEFWRSPLRGPWLTSAFGAVLLIGIPVLFVTGLLSYAAYNPDLGANDKTPDRGWLGFYLFAWPTDPHWLYRLTQGVHVTLGIVLVPVLLAKLWSVVPRLFTWPPVRSVSHALERLSVLLLVGGALFEFATGVLNIQLDYVFPGSFYPLHFYGAWVFIGAFVVHVAFRIPLMVRMLRGGGLREELRHPAGRAARPVPDGGGLVAPDPAPPSISRRGALSMVGAGSLALLVVNAGQSIGGSWRVTALLAPRGQDPGPGPNGFQVNKTAAGVGIRARDVGPAWRLVLRGAGQERVLSRAQLLALPQHRAALPIACVEGWSTEDQLWSGVRLRDLAALVGHPHLPPGVFVQSAQRSGSFRSTTLRDNQVRDPRSLLALRVNGADLSPDHGYPARVIVPANPGVHNTKWVTRLTFGDGT
ncbi:MULTISPECIES: molybdopterin-dependent oxidoreductase [unclassified Streptomyces]|uniref:molybdopterin-dependent oxidoreductase n=1 Tax=unclassified Streptomyces TaxID=2593676 RepID=UPI0001C18BE8|nr:MULTISPECIES: molybdopterin-dependent oxidoreductase [unclassified Streptomyces]AEN13749.1 oxidoreductase molybdopterin binding protein [Streptomyces sp. SirexAA-E]MYR64580.1 molybdopterin-dependent oxidoreductase [Streptomyces sp. SID4939]MYR99226.1 molybdopterin-dependent oxidoreductase [Streptomyces sp. SID4940]MYT67637.1 molybdopterin-dependent oxidoreductase [Streptomyces sp. SID8357]MYT86481.1 molybdopterin-dependent oxidoreductase [Streptomyces sp. SID8360]